MYCSSVVTFPDQDKVCVFATVKEKQLSWDQSSKTPNQDWSQMDIVHTFIHPARFWQWRWQQQQSSTPCKSLQPNDTTIQVNSTNQQYKSTSCHSIASLSRNGNDKKQPRVSPSRWAMAKAYLDFDKNQSRVRSIRFTKKSNTGHQDDQGLPAIYEGAPNRTV
ncbi:hypothetical protein CLU79DRAFT_722241 [Phycomyces nitens]|nr:hypothetical protein CLU79DRAFT_722241 [Phycomyces nitens]